MRKFIVGVMGPGSKATEKDIQNAAELGRLIAEHDWVLLSGGRNSGVMHAVNKAAKEKGGVTIGIIPTKDKTTASEYVDFPILTNMGSARNYINILSSDVIIACGMGAGTASEVALAIKDQKYVILLTDDQEGNRFFQKLDPIRVFVVNSSSEAITKVEVLLSNL